MFLLTSFFPVGVVLVEDEVDEGVVDEGVEGVGDGVGGGGVVGGMVLVLMGGMWVILGGWWGKEVKEVVGEGMGGWKEWGWGVGGGEWGGVWRW